MLSAWCTRVRRSYDDDNDVVYIMFEFGKCTFLMLPNQKKKRNLLIPELYTRRKNGANRKIMNYDFPFPHLIF